MRRAYASVGVDLAGSVGEEGGGAVIEMRMISEERVEKIVRAILPTGDFDEAKLREFAAATQRDTKLTPFRFAMGTVAFHGSRSVPYSRRPLTCLRLPACTVAL